MDLSGANIAEYLAHEKALQFKDKIFDNVSDNFKKICSIIDVNRFFLKKEK